MEVAADLISRGEADAGAVVVTAHQSAGRGTHGRQWFDEPGSALLATMIVAAERVDALLPLRVGLALCDLLESFGIAGPRIKWPNDCMCDNAKIAGILTRLEPPHALIGVGLNVTSAPAAGATSVAAELARTAAAARIRTAAAPRSDSMRTAAGGAHDSAAPAEPTPATGGARDSAAPAEPTPAAGGARDSAAPVTPEALLEPFLAAVCRRLDATELARDCRARLWGLGRTVHIERPDRESIAGTIVGVSGDGALIISRNNKEERIYAGRIRM